MAKFKGAILTCEECGKEYKVPHCRSKTAKYCSKECADVHRQDTTRVEQIEKECLRCGKKFHDHPCHSERRKYCSYECANQSAVEEEVRICAYCGEPFTVNPSSSNLCCSWECRAARSKSPNWPLFKKILKQCVQCGKEFYRAFNQVKRNGGKFCSQQCKVDSQKTGKYENPSFYTSGPWYQARKRILERDKSTCQQCGFTGKGLAIHHCEFKRNGGTEGDDNLITLCRHCHMVEHWNLERTV